MKRWMRALLAVAAASLVFGQASKALAADAWPSRPVRLVITSAAGTGSDIIARTMADRLSLALKQQVFVDNRPGANGIVAHTRSVGGGA